MKIVKTSLPVFIVSLVLVAPLWTSAATVSATEHPAPPLPPGAKAGVVGPSITSATSTAPAEIANPTKNAGAANVPATTVNSFGYVGTGIVALLALALGFFLGKRKN